MPQFDSYGRGYNRLGIVVTFDGTYTIEMTRFEGPMYTRDHKEYIRGIPYLPKSVLQMLSATGQNVGVDGIIATLKSICSETLPEEKNEMEQANETILQLRAELASSHTHTDELTAELSHVCEMVVETQKKFDEIQVKNTELVDIIVDKLQKIVQLEETIQLSKSIEQHSLDTMLDSAFDELNM